jgi:hypothetical protein
MPLTAASLSMALFFRESSLIKPKIPLMVDEVIRKAYYGGRCEVFGNPKKNEKILHFDFKGMYAQCMEERVPCGELKISNIIKDLSKPGFYLINFTQNMEIPVLPLKHQEKLFFPNGTFEGWYWFEEIKLFLDEGGLVNRVKAAVYSDFYEPEIKSFVQKNNSIREFSPYSNLIGKNNNNVFYGKIGMSPKSTIDEITTDRQPKIGSTLFEVDGILINSREQYKPHSNVSISASITSKARIKLYKTFKKLQNEGARLLYTDTDSIIIAVKAVDYHKFIDKKIGEAFFDSKKQDTEIERAAFALPKSYSIRLKCGKEITKMKGFTEKITFNKFQWAFKEKKEIKLKQQVF